MRFRDVDEDSNRTVGYRVHIFHLASVTLFCLFYTHTCPFSNPELTEGINEYELSILENDGDNSC